jgi:hypothetical protein
VLEAAHTRRHRNQISRLKTQTAEDTSKQHIRDRFISLHTERAHAVVGQVVALQPLRHPTTSQQEEPNEELANRWGSSFVQLFSAEDASLSDEKGTVHGGRRVLIGLRPFL